MSILRDATAQSTVQSDIVTSVVRSGGIEVLIRAILTHTSFHAILHHSACSALFMIARWGDGTTRQRMWDGRCIRAGVTTLNRFPTDLLLFGTITGTLGLLSIGSETRRTTIVQEGGIQAIVKSLLTSSHIWQYDERNTHAIQDNACMAIDLLAKNDFAVRSAVDCGALMALTTELRPTADSRVVQNLYGTLLGVASRSRDPSYCLVF